MTLELKYLEYIIKQSYKWFQAWRTEEGKSKVKAKASAEGRNGLGRMKVR